MGASQNPQKWDRGSSVPPAPPPPPVPFRIPGQLLAQQWMKMWVATLFFEQSARYNFHLETKQETP